MNKEDCRALFHKGLYKEERKHSRAMFRYALRMRKRWEQTIWFALYGCVASFAIGYLIGHFKP